MKNILITGAAGFIGANLSSSLISKGYNVIGVDNLSVKPVLKPSKDIKIIDVQSIDSDFLLDYKVEKIVHLAAKKNVKESFYNLDNSVENFEMTLKLFSAAVESQVTNIYLASTCEIFGYQDKLLDEKSDFNPYSPYAVSKVANEHLANVYMRYKNTFKVTSLNFFNTYGPTEGVDAVIPNFVLKAINNENIIIEGDGLQARDFTFIDDTINVLVSILENDKNYYRYLNIGTGEDASILKIYEILKESFPSLECEFIEKRPNEVKTFIADNSIIKQKFNFKSEISLKNGIKKVIDFYLDSQ